VVAELGDKISRTALNTKQLSTVADLVAWVASRSKGLRRIA